MDQSLEIVGTGTGSAPPAQNPPQIWHGMDTINQSMMAMNDNIGAVLTRLSVMYVLLKLESLLQCRQRLIISFIFRDQNSTARTLNSWITNGQTPLTPLLDITTGQVINDFPNVGTM
jgi:hypothetical protein